LLERHALNESQGGIVIVAFLGIFVLGDHVMAPTVQRQEISLDNCHKFGQESAAWTELAQIR
jgi:hypothetical protein